MWKMIQTEWWKLRRCQILLVGIVALALCPVAQYGTQLIVNPEIRDPNFDFVHLFANVVWGNTQVFLPISLVMIGGWLIDRENTHDTMKNLLTVPVSYPKLLGGKLAATALLSLLFGLYSAAVTVLTGMLAGLPGLTPGVILQQGGQVVAAALTTFLVCMPMVLIFGQMRGAYLGGSILAFFLGYCILFFKGGFLLSAYPFSAALVAALALDSCGSGARTELFNGRDLTGWVCVTDGESDAPADGVFSVLDGNIRITGTPFGYMRTARQYGDYRLHVEWRWIGAATNSGIFQRVQEGDKVWPDAIECQM